MNVIHSNNYLNQKMGICYESKDGRIIRLTKQTLNKFKENKEKKVTNPKISKNFEEFKFNEIKCSNFYNINSNYNFSISNNDSKDKYEEPIDELKLMNQPIQYLYKEKSINEDIYQKLLTIFNSTINQYPYNNLSQNQIVLLENEYTEYRIVSPYKFIESKEEGKIFNKIYEICFLKCEPLLNNINDDDKKGVNLIFFRSVIILLRENTIEKTIDDIANSFMELSHENNSNYINKDNFYFKIKSFCEICYQIIFYFFIARNQFSEEKYYEYLSEPNLLINDKYSNVDLDIFSINSLYDNNKGTLLLEEIVKQWSDYICGNINYEKLYSDIFNKNNVILISLINKIKEMLNPFHLFEVLAGLKLSNT